MFFCQRTTAFAKQMTENSIFCPTEFSRCCEFLSVWRKEAYPVAEALFLNARRWTEPTKSVILNVICPQISVELPSTITSKGKNKGRP